MNRIKGGGVAVHSVPFSRIEVLQNIGACFLIAPFSKADRCTHFMHQVNESVRVLHIMLQQYKYVIPLKQS